MSKVRLVSFFLIMFVFLSGSVMLNEARAVREIIYYGNNVVDIEVAIGGGENFMTHLYRGDDKIHEWIEPAKGTTIYYCDQAAPVGEHSYQYWEYKKTGDAWVRFYVSVPKTANTNYFHGHLHNNAEWLAKLNRGAVSWGPETVINRVVDVEDGKLNIANGTLVEVIDGGSLSVNSPGEISAESVTFSKLTGIGLSKVSLSNADACQPFNNCIFEGVELELNYCDSLQIANNTFIDVRINDLYHQCRDLLIQGNTASSGSQIIISAGGTNATIKDNNGFTKIQVMSNCTVEGNQAGWIYAHYDGSSNLIRENTVSYISVRSDENQILENSITGDDDYNALTIQQGSHNLIKDNTLLNTSEYFQTGIVITASGGDAIDNTVEGNEIKGFGDGIELIEADYNLIKKNDLIRNLGNGIVLDDSSHNNIENNACNENLDIGLEITGDSYDNAVAFNHIWGGESGIVVDEDAHGNGFHENKVEYNDVGIYTESRNNYIYNNIFRRNLQNAFDDGVTNTWNRGSAVEAQNIVGGPYLGGNYWDDYKGADSDGDGIGETPYAIFGAFTDAVSYDNLPLIWESDTPPYLVLSDGDYNGDGSSDIAIFRKSSGLWAVRGVTRVYFGGDGDIPVSGDYNGDGTTDISIFRRSSGLWAIRGVSRLYFGGATDTTVPGDYNGDGSCDPGIFRENYGLWAIRGVTRTYFGQPLDKPVPGNYSGAGFASIALFRPSAGLWAIKDLGRFYFGNDEDMPVAADYDGNGTRDLAIFRRSEGLWAVAGVTRAYFGGLYDRPAPADYTGASTDKIALFREMSALWAIRGVTRVYFGGSSDIPATR